MRDGLNWYVYCVNNPLVFVDPTGMAAYADEDGNFIEFDDNDDDNNVYLIDEEGNKTDSIFCTLNDIAETKRVFREEYKDRDLRMHLDFRYEDESQIIKETDDATEKGNELSGLTKIFFVIKQSWQGANFGGMDYSTILGAHKIYVIDGIGYTHWGAGNYLWAITMKRLGYTKDFSILGANVNNFFSPSWILPNNQNGLLYDDPADTRAHINAYESEIGDLVSQENYRANSPSEKKCITNACHQR